MLRLLSIAALALAAGCAAPRYAGPSVADLSAGQARCRVGAGRSNPLVTEWSAAEKASLEALLGGGAVAVEYTGCAMRVLTECRLGGGYQWQRTTPASDTIEIEDEDELYAKIPLGAVSLAGELKRSGKLTVVTTVSGQLRLSGATPADVPAQGECARATHVLSALAVGAFSLSGKATGGGKADVTVAEFGAGAKSQRSAGIVRSAGDAQACGQSGGTAPHPNCRSPIQAFLWPIPGRAFAEGPPGTVKVDLVSANPSDRWDVYYDDEVICSTPCSHWLHPSRPLMLRSRSPGMGGQQRIEVQDLEPWAGAGSVQVQARGTSNGKFATGVTFAALGGMAAISGLVLAPIGCGGGDNASSGMCTAGLVTLGVGTAVTLGSVAMIMDALPRAEIRPGGRLGRPISVAVGPGFVAGTF